MAVRSGGFSSLLQKGLAKVRAGLTTPDELLRILQVEEEEVAACPNCRAQIDPDFTVCPYCSRSLKSVCRECRQQLRPKWTICPYCGTPAEESEAAAGGRMPSLADTTGSAMPTRQNHPPTAPAPASSEVTADRAQAPAGSPETTASPGKTPEAAFVPPRSTKPPKQVKILVVDDDPSI